MTTQSCVYTQKTQTYTYEEIKECQFQSWYQTFRKSKLGCKKSNEMNSTPRSIIIPLPPKFIDYLLSDGVRLPADATKVSSCVDAVFETSDDDFWNSHDDEDQDEEDSDDDNEECYSFPGLTETVSQAISQLGGSVFPKLNWSSPKDAAWMNGGSLKCKTVGDIYLLLKSSDFIVHDLIHGWDDLEEGEKEKLNDEKSPDQNEYVLILRKWCNLHKSMEFRCFVAANQLVAISQRDHTQHYTHLQSTKMQLRQNVIDCFENIIQESFANGLVRNYVFDCYIDKDHRVWIIDFNVWGTRTDSLLFTWEELEKMRNGIMDSVDESVNDIIDTTKNPEIRIVDWKNEVHHDPLASYRAPIDTVDLASDSQGANSFAEFMSKCEKPFDIGN